MKFQVPDMSCGHCTATIEKALKEAEPGCKVSCDLDAKTITLASARDMAALRATLEKAGYPATPA